MKRCGLLGEKLSHSFSPLIHSQFGDYEYKLFEISPENLDAFMTERDFDGLNVTIPYKKDVIPYCAELSETACEVGSVNTIIRQPDGSLHGDNTDYFGFAYLLGKAGADVTKGKTLVLGSGGSSLAVQAVLRKSGAKETVIISRHGADNYDNIGKHNDAVLIVNTTPVGMYPNTGISPLAELGVFDKLQAVIDLIYNPARTHFLLDAQELGITALGGLSMLVAQAAKASELFTGIAISDGQIEAVTDKISRMTQNIVLIGMPGCGKTTIGKELAGKLGREFFDTDVEIEKTAGKSIPDIFEQDGEEAFRKLETSTLEKLCTGSGLVIATGGGVVTQPVNLNLLRQNSRIVYLRRDLSELSLDGRPLSQSTGVEELAQQRLPLYKTWCDFFVDVDSDAAVTAQRILEVLK